MLSLEEVVLVTGALCVRAMMSIHPHSGQDQPPMYGDFEAQRHWQEITLNLPLKEWYANTADNNLTYWGLDYPPLTAYHSLLMGHAAQKWPVGSHNLSDSVKLQTSRGYQTPLHKVWMRGTVLLADALVLVPAALAFARTTGAAPKRSLALVLILLYPGLIIIDNGHFQYNNISLGLMIGAVAATLHGLDCFSALLFVCALNYKQMELYHALPFFSYFLGKCWQEPTILRSAWKLAKIGVTVIAAFAAIWAPIAISAMPQDGEGLTKLRLDVESVVQVLRRIFPLQRGLFEDKVANFWCSINILLKVREVFDTQQLVQISGGLTLAASFPSNLMVLLRPTSQNLLFSLTNTSLAFFLFSFHVHEKTILVAAVPLLMLLGHAGYVRRRSALISAWFLIVTVFSMLPLLQKDKLVLPAVSLTSSYLVLCHYCKLLEPDTSAEASGGGGATPSKPGGRSVTPKPMTSDDLASAKGSTWSDWAVWTLFNLSITGCIAFVIASIYVKPPPRYPDLWPVLVSAFSAAHFGLFYLYFNFYQLTYHLNCCSNAATSSTKVSMASPPLAVDSRKKRN